MSALEYKTLIYRGNYELTVGVSYEGCFLRNEKGGGLSTTEKLFPGLLYAKLNYSALLNRVMVQPEVGEPVSRLLYIWKFYRDSMDNGMRPFLMRVPPPLPESLYMWEFTDLSLELSAVDRHLTTTGLSVRQTFVEGMNFLPDGSIADELINPVTL